MSGREELSLPQQVERLKAENEELRRRLLQAQRLTSVGSLAFSITHEFNNILTTVINYAKLGLRHKDAGSRDKAFDKILSAGQRASKITTGLLAYAKNKETRYEPADLVQLVQDVLVLVEKDLQTHRVKLETQFEGRPWARVCGTQIQQVVLNLMINARQAMEGGGQLTLGVRLGDEGMVEISVRDTGTGIPQEKLRSIFEPFYTTKTADAQGQGGSGIGLSLCREIITAHQGRIRVDSTVGRGTTFTLKLPEVQPPAMPNAGDASKPALTVFTA